jgi:anti-anti-sigma factor
MPLAELFGAFSLAKHMAASTLQEIIGRHLPTARILGGDMNLKISRRETHAIVLVAADDLPSDLRALDGSLQLADITGDNSCPPLVVLDLAAVKFIDSAGIGWLIMVSRHVQREGGKLRLANLTASVRKVLEIMRLDQILPHFPSVDAALFATPA